MADEKSTDPGAATRLQTTYDEDEREAAAVLRRVLELHPVTLTKDELLRDLTGGGSAVFSSVDANDRAVRDLAGAGLLRAPGDDQIVRPTRAALRFFELAEGSTDGDA